MPEGEGDIPTGIDGETNGDGQTEEKDSNNNSSSSGPAIGVGVGAALGAAALSIFVAWLLWRRRWKKQQQEGGGKGDDGSFYPPPGVVVGVVGGLSLRHAPAINSHQVVSLQATSTTTTTTTSNGAAGTLVAGGGRAVIMASPLAGPRYGFKRRNDTATSATATGTTGTTSITNTSTSSSSQATTTAADVAQEVILHEQIGQGAFGVVYRGKWSGEDVAVKVLQTACSAQSRELKSFAQEASLLSTLTHPNVIRLIAACTTPPNICIVEELATGGSLYDLLHYSRSSSNDGEDVAAATAEQPSTSTPPPPPKQERRRQRNPLPYGQLLELAVQVADAMSYLHVKARIVHRDLKPQNILLSGKDRSIAKICDLGIAKFKDRTFLSTVNGQAGTPQYMAPELFDGGPVSDKVDIFSFAVVLWEMVTGEVPWSNAPSPMQIIYYIGVLGQRLPIPMACPPELRRIIEACWADVPTSRPSFPQILQWLQDELQRVEMDPELRDRRMPTAAYMQDILEEEEEEEEGGEHYVENNNNNEHMPSGDLEGHHITEEDNKRTSDVESGTVASHGSSPTAVVIENAGGSSSSKASPLYFGHMLHSFEASASEGSMMSTR
jgi:serine/threonine protein kinase